MQLEVDEPHIVVMIMDHNKDAIWQHPEAEKILGREGVYATIGGSLSMRIVKGEDLLELGQ